MMGQKPRRVPPVPPEFEQEFVTGGWRRVERLYNARTDLLWKWIHMSGGDALIQKRRAFQRGEVAIAVNSQQGSTNAV